MTKSFSALPYLLVSTLLAPAMIASARAADAVPPAEVANLQVTKSGNDVVLTWDATMTNAVGGAENTTSYRIYRGSTPGFVPDRSASTNLLGTSSSPTFTHVGGMLAAGNSFYYVSAVDDGGSEGNTRRSKVTTAPTVSRTFSTTAASLTWSGAAPGGSIAGYKAFYGTASLSYDLQQNPGNVTSTSISPLSQGITYFFDVLAYDAEGNLASPSNEVSGQLVAGGGPTEVCGRISTSTTWLLSQSPYVVTCDVNVYADTSPFNSAPPPAVLTIEPGVIVKFNAGTGLNIGNGANAGGLVAQGTAASPIVFTANQTFPLSGAWKGITFADATTAGSLIEQAVVEYGGIASGAAILESTGQANVRFTLVRGSLNYGIRVTGGAAPLLENLTIRDTGAAALRFETSSPTLRNSLVQTSGGYGVSVSGANSSVIQNNTLDHGVFFDNASGNPVITGNTFERYAGFPIQVGADDVGELLAQNTIHGAGGSDVLQMMGERVQTTATWSNPGFPLVVVNSNVPVYGDLVSTVTLTLQAGVQVRFAQFAYLQVGSGANRGALVAQGTPAAPILLTSNLASPAAGNWGGVFFDDGADDATSVLDRVTISYAGYLFSSGVRASASSPTVRNTIVLSSSVYGVYLSNSNAVVEDCSISLTGSNGIRSDGGGSPALRRNTISSPTGYGLYVSGANSAQIEDNVVANAIFFDNAGGNPFIDGNTFSNFDSNVPRLGADDVAEFLNGNTFQNASAAGRLEVMGEVINASATWPATAFPLNVISADIVVGNSPTTPVVLTLAPGVVLRFASGIRLEVGTTVNRGGLVAAGTPAQPILFTTSNATPAAGQWQGIYFDTFADTATSLLDRCTIEYAGQTYSANVRVVASAPTIRNSTVRNSSVYGIYGTSSPSPTIQGNVFANNVNFDVYMSGTSNAQVTGNTFTSALFFDTAAGTHAVTGNTFNAYNNAAKNLRVGAHAVAGLGSNIFNGTGPASQYEILGETLTADATWPNVGFPGVVLQDTVVAKDPTNAATLTLAPGATLRFNASTGLFIGTTVNKGALVAAGTAAQPITFTTNNATPAPGQWEGIYFDSMAVSATCLLDHVVAEYAGQTYSGDVRIISVAPTIRNSTFRNSSVYGIYGTSSPSPTIQTNAFSGNVNFDVYMSGTSNAQVTGNTFTSAVFFDTAAGTHAVTGNTFNAYNNAARNLRVGAHAAAGLGSNTFSGTGTASTAELLSETLAVNASWAPLGFPYIALGDIVVAKDPTTASVLTLQAGVSIRFAASVGLFVGTGVNRGALVVNGTAAQPVLFTTNNATPAPGQWQGIYFDSLADGATSLVDHAIVEYAGQTYSGDIRLIGVSPTIRNSTIRNSSVYGIYGTSSPSPTIQNNVFAGNTNLDVLISGTSNAQLTGNTFTSAMQFDTAAGTHAVTGNTFNGYNNAARNLRVGAHAAPGLSTNTFNGTGTASAAEILSETIATDATWNALGFPYLPLSDLVVAKDPVNASTLTLSPGVVMKFNAGTGLFIGTTVNKGALVAAGTVAQPITFTTNNATPAPGQWEGVYFDSMAVSATSLLDHVVVEYAGQTYSGDVRIVGVSPTIRNSTFRNSSVYGLYGTSQPSPLVQTNVFTGNVNYDAFFDGGSATVTGNTFAHALRFDSITGTPVVTSNTFNTYVGPFLLRFGADAVDGMSGNVFNGTDATSKVELLGETLSANARWRLQTVPYAVLTSNVVVSGTFTTPARLTIDPGVTIRFGASLRLVVASGTTQADLVAQGTVAQPITFTTDNAAPAAGQWQGIYLDNGTAFDSVIENVVIEYAGQGSTAGLWLNRADTPVRNSIVRFSSSYGIVLADSSSVVQNVQVTNTGNYGILMQGNAAERTPSITGCTINPVNAFNGLRGQGTMTPTITGNTITNAAFFESAAGRPVIQNNVFNNYDPFPIRVGADSIGIMTGNTFNGTGAQSRVEVLGETLSADATWANLGMPYLLITNSVTVAKSATQGALLTIAPGVTMKFSAGLGLFVGTNTSKGALAAVGTQAQPILFTTANAAPAPGQWQAVYFDSASVDEQDILDFCTVEYGGTTYNADVVANNANPTIRRSVMRRSLQHGLLMTSASPAVTFNQFLDNTLYGVAATGASFPVLQHNTFTGNVSGAVSNTATSIVDARLNWFGNASGPGGSGPGTGQGVTANIAFDPWLGTSFTTTNLFTDLFTSTRTFKPGSFTRFNGGLLQASAWTLRLFDSGNAVVRTITGNSQGIATSWDGKDDGAVNLVDGTYRYQFDATANGTGDAAAPVVGRVAVDGTFALGEVNVPTYLQTYSVGTSVPVSGTAAGTGFTNYTLQFGAGLFPSSFTNIVTSSTAITGATLGTWNTTGQQNGVYSVRLLVNNNLAEQTVVNVGTFVLSVNTLAIDRPFFSPNGDGSLDETTATSTLSTSADWTVKVVDNATSAILRTFTGTGSQVTQTWDGKLADLVTTAPEGVYRFDLTAVKNGQTVASSSATMALDLTPPSASIVLPSDGSPVFGSVGITGNAFDPDNHFQNYLLEFGIGGSPLSFSAIGTTVTTPVTGGGALGTWVTNDFGPTEPVANGGYQIRLTATDKAGNLQRSTRQVSLDNLVLGQVGTSKTTVDVGLNETAAINFAINKPATVTLKIYPETAGEAGAIQRTIPGGSLSPGTHSFIWDGKGAGGALLPDEAYVYVLEADAGSGRTDKYSPPGGLAGGSGSGSPDPAYNPYTNDFWSMPYTNSSPARVTMQVTPTGLSVFDVFTLEPHEGGTFPIEWDGRNPGGAIVTQTSSVYFPPPTTLRPNYIITTGNKPRLTGIASDPYRLFMSYAHVSRFAFTLGRDATVTVTVLPPGINNPADPSGRTIMTATPLTAGNYTVLFDPIDPGVANEDTFRFSAEGPYTFAVQAVNPTSGATSLRRGVVTMFR